MNDYPKILAIQSDKKELNKVEEFLKHMFIKENWPADSFSKVFLVVSEAVLNSIEHGNKNDKDKKVTLKVSCTGNNLKIDVRDEGKGFNYDMVKDPTLNENRLRETGRGIFIMKTISSKIEFHDCGKCVEIIMTVA